MGIDDAALIHVRSSHVSGCSMVFVEMCGRAGGNAKPACCCLLRAPAFGLSTVTAIAVHPAAAARLISACVYALSCTNSWNQKSDGFSVATVSTGTFV